MESVDALVTLLVLVIAGWVLWLRIRLQTRRRHQSTDCRCHATPAEADAALRQAKEAAEAANRAKSQFLANISHEIRTPLGVIIGYADLLTDPQLGPSDRAAATAAVRRNAQHLLQIVNDVLDFSRIEAGRLPLERLACPLMPLAREVIAAGRVHAHEKGLRLEVVARSPLPPFIHTDPTRLRQVLDNLVSNAVKFTPGGRRAGLYLGVEPHPDHLAGVLVLAVEDEGIGITTEQMSRLFRPFQQGDSSTTRTYGGTGLGLSITRHLTEALGGQIEVWSEPGRGSRFTVRLPLAADDPPPQARPAPPTPEPPPANRRARRLAGRVLLAEDGRDNRQVVSYHLAAAGLSVEVAENGQAAVTRAVAEPFDLILMDMQMPLLDGYDATRTLRERGYAGPIVALTAHAQPGDEARCRRAGCTDYLSKPVEPGRLLDTLARYLPPAGADDNGSGARTFRRLVRRFADALPEQAQALQAALDAGDRVSLGRLAHRLLGASGMYGFGQVGEVAGLIESACDEGQDEGLLRELLVELVDEIERCRNEVGEG